jgi:predicted DNA-binding protein (MmcQ/YjbR family)
MLQPRAETDVDASELCERCLVQTGAHAGYPFGPGVLVIKVAGRIFAIVAEGADPPTVSLKCDPDLARTLRDTYAAVAPGYHLDKRHWNTVTLDGTIGDDEVVGWIEDSYDLVVDRLPRYVQRQLGWPAGGG